MRIPSPPGAVQGVRGGFQGWRGFSQKGGPVVGGIERQIRDIDSDLDLDIDIDLQMAMDMDSDLDLD